MSRRDWSERERGRRAGASRWTAGSVMSWALGVTLGVILGIAMLIIIPRTLGKPSTASPNVEGTISTPAEQPSAQGRANSMGSGPDAQAQATGAAAEGENGTAAEGAGSTAPTSQTSGSDSSSSTASGQSNSAGGERAGDPAAGQTVFTSYCGACHGQGAQGGGIGPSLLTADGPKSWTLAQFTTAIRQGRTPERELNPTMPRFSETQVSDQQLVDLLAYIKSL